MATLVSPSTTLRLTQSQETAVNGIIHNIKKGVSPSVLCGYAGTGKTVSTAALVSRLVASGRRVVVATPTHKARAQVDRALKARGAFGLEVVTVHRLLGLRQRINYETGEETFEADPKSLNMLTETHKWDDETKKKVKADPVDVVIIDETSMIKSSIYNLLLKDTRNKSLVFVGDDRQLLPVGESEVCPAFTKSPSVYRLTEVLRHDGAILNLATATRELKIGRARFESSHGGETRVIAYDRPSEWLEALLEMAKREESVENPDHCRVLAHSNVAVEEMNDRIHQYIYGFNAPEYCPGMICVTSDAVPDPLGGRTLLHSTVDLLVELAELSYWKPDLKIASVDRWGLPSVTSPKLPAEIEKFFNDEQKYECWNLTVDVASDGDYQQTERIKVIAKSSQQRWSQAQSFIAAQAKSTNDSQLRKTLWKLYYMRKNQIAKIQPAWALTVHKSQGSTFKHVFLHPSIDDIRNIQNQVSYVGITRAAETLHVIADK